MARGCVLVISVAVLLLPASAERAGAVILPASTIDGPSSEIVGFGGVAMAEDGTGGLVYLKRVEGVSHVFVARFVNDAWQAPIRVDVSQPYAASSPRIGAANGGELVVVWVTPLGTEQGRIVNELVGATLGPGSATFGPAKLVDPNIGSATGVSPDLAMSSTGQADVVYRVLDETPGQPSSIPLLRPGDVVEEVRVAHFEGETWTRLGSINRDSGVSMRAPAATNAPQIAIGPTGNGIVVWQEPEITGVARIWARRIYGRTLDYVMSASAATYNGAAISDDADAPSVAVTPTGEAVLAYRQTASPGSPLPGPRIFLDTLSDGLEAEGTEFLGSHIADEAVSGGYAAAVGPPTVDTDANNDVRLIYDANGAARVISSYSGGATLALSLGSPFTSAAEAPASTMDPEGGGLSAWPSSDASGPGVALREDFPAGGVQTAIVRGGGGGPVSELAVGRSALGDGLVGFLQGPLGNAAIVAEHASAPPAQFLVSVPSEWVTAAHAVISWSASPTSNGPVRYEVVRDGRVSPVASGVMEMHISPTGLASGVHTIQVLAIDATGQATLTPSRQLRIDDSSPRVSLRRRGHSLAVSVIDPYSGVAKRSVSISFGDGTHSGGRTSFHHRYASAGVYTVVVSASSRLGTHGVSRHLVSVP
jgi:hypothetical protein